MIFKKIFVNPQKIKLKNKNQAGKQTKNPRLPQFMRSMLKSIFWFSVGGSLGLFLFVSFVFIYFKQNYNNVVYPGVTVNGVLFGGKSEEEVRRYFDNKNSLFASTKFVFDGTDEDISTTAQELEYGYDSKLLAYQAYSIGRSANLMSNLSLVFQAYIGGVYLQPSYRYSEEKLDKLLKPIIEKQKVEPVDALFTFENGRVTAFQPSSDGKEVDVVLLKKDLEDKRELIVNKKVESIKVDIPIKILHPKISTDQVNNLGIKELLATGTSLFQGSIPNRIHNVTVAANKINGVLVAPNEEFSFTKTLGDVSVFTGFKQAYVIENGKTVLGDGGGVCQVSTTLFRAILSAGFPITERHAHAYRVHYYEEDSPPGIDATIYSPSVDLRFKNTSGHSILIQTAVDQETLRLNIALYGTKDNREVSISTPIITSQSPAPEALYQDDPTLPKGTIKQVDFAAAGANVFFTRTVKKDGKTILSDKFVSNYRPWQAIYLRGTQ